MKEEEEEEGCEFFFSLARAARRRRKKEKTKPPFSPYLSRPPIGEDISAENRARASRGLSCSASARARRWTAAERREDDDGI